MAFELYNKTYDTSVSSVNLFRNLTIGESSPHLQSFIDLASLPAPRLLLRVPDRVALSLPSLPPPYLFFLSLQTACRGV